MASSAARTVATSLYELNKPRVRVEVSKPSLRRRAASSLQPAGPAIQEQLELLASRESRIDVERVPLAGRRPVFIP